jgi:signal transduction histidine kinase
VHNLPAYTYDPADSATAIAQDVAAVGRISVLPSMLKLLCENTGMGFAAVARVTEGTWTACAVEDRINFGLRPGSQIDIDTTLCRESRAVRKPIAIDHASLDPIYRDHHTPRIYNIESYVSVPIVRRDGTYFGNLCAIDPNPAQVSDPRTVHLFTSLAEMIAIELSNDDEHTRSELEVRIQREHSDLREQFIAVLGHDLRNPLQAVASAAEILVRRPDASDKKLGERLRGSTHRMAGLVDNLLDLARARLGSGIGVEIRKADSLATMLRGVVDEIRTAHPEVDIRESIDVDLPVACDPGRLQQLLSNMLGNAHHHGASGKPVTVDVHVKDAVLEISVGNGGEGIAEEDLSKIFQPYWRPVTSKPGGGLGLGLYICSEIVKAHAGTLHATSSAEQGTRFTARIPIHPPSASAHLVGID